MRKKLLSSIKIIICKFLFRQHNKQNGLYLESPVHYSLVKAGKCSYGPINIQTDIDKNQVIIGNYVSIAHGVKFILGKEHRIDRISTYPFKTKLVSKVNADSFSKGNIIIEDDVWIGESVIILSGVTIKQGAVVAAGAVVTKDIPPYAIVGGVPAKVIKYRFSQDMINELLKIDYSRLKDEMIKEHIDDLYHELTSGKQLDWMPKK